MQNRQLLIDKGNDICKRLLPFTVFGGSVKGTDEIFEYVTWYNDVIKFSEENGIRENMSARLFPIDSMSNFGLIYKQNFIPLGRDGEDFLQIFSEQIDFLKKAPTINKIVIFIEKDSGNIYIKDIEKGKLSHQFRNGPGDKGFSNLIKICDSKRPIPAKKLNRSTQAISKQLRIVNERLNDTLGLESDLIINKSNNGYQIDKDKYLIKFL